MQTSLKKIFSDYMEQQHIFKNKNMITTSYKPNDIPHRDTQIHTVARILSPALKNQRPSNIFIYGKPGTGKTTVVSYVTRELNEMSPESESKHSTMYVNCKMKGVADTEYRILAQLCKELGVKVPATGLPTSKVYETFEEAIDSQKRTVILVLDEIDVLVEKIGDNLLYNLVRLNESLENSQLSIIGISNNLSFTHSLDPRVVSSLNEEEVLFAPYNAMELMDILRTRSNDVFNEDCLEDGVIEKCAALAAQEHGDARRALDLLRVAGEIAERNNTPKVKIEHIDQAEDKIDEDRVVEIVRSQPRQSQMVLWSIISSEDTNSGNLYGIYEKHCSKNNLKPLTRRRVSDLISELDLFGIIETEVISKGRYGRTKNIKLSIDGKPLQEISQMLSTEFYFQ